MFKKPNLFIIGAPKCGTTSLAAWLSEQDEVYMCTPKEPAYFNHDHRKVKEISLREYESYFGKVTPRQRVVGEASTAYLRSQVAVPEILRYAPEAKFVVGLRDSVEMALSWHAQSVYECYENVKDFSQAWLLQDKRRVGVSVPPLCRDPTGLIYGDVCRLGAQVERLLSVVPRSRVCFYWLEEVQRDTKDVWHRVCDFLDINEHARSSFPILNQRKSVPLGIRLTARLFGDMKRALGLSRYELGVMKKLNFRQPADRAVSADTRKMLEDYFKEDKALLRKLVGSK